MPGSSKTLIIEALFNSRWDEVTRTISDPYVTLEQVQDAILEFNKTAPASKRLSPRNPANFIKDFIRNKARGNANWPDSVFQRGFTARQVTGQNMCFEFVPIKPGQKKPFPIRIIHPSGLARKHKIQSASMSLASRRLGRNDEAWLIQVLVKLNVVATHLAISSDGRIIQVDFLQSNLKQARTEIDAVFLAFEKVEGRENLDEIIVTCEAKGRKDDIIEEQLIAQVKAVFKMPGVTQNVVIPIAAKAIRPSEVHIVQFGAVRSSEVDDLEALDIVSEALYELVPAVPGIGI